MKLVWWKVNTPFSLEVNQSHDRCIPRCNARKVFLWHSINMSEKTSHKLTIYSPALCAAECRQNVKPLFWLFLTLPVINDHLGPKVIWRRSHDGLLCTMWQLVFFLVGFIFLHFCLWRGHLCFWSVWSDDLMPRRADWWESCNVFSDIKRCHYLCGSYAVIALLASQANFVPI